VTTARPVPVPDDLSSPYWAAAARHELALPRCGRCGAISVPPDVTCPRCATTEPGWAYETVAGGGTVRSWTVVRQSFLPGFDADLPFVLVDVELDAQPDLRLVGRLLDGVDAPLAVGDRVEVAFEDIGPDASVPAFELAR
jgi:uncharacterized OB-fold protein